MTQPDEPTDFIEACMTSSSHSEAICDRLDLPPAEILRSVPSGRV